MKKKRKSNSPAETSKKQGPHVENYFIEIKINNLEQKFDSGHVKLLMLDFFGRDLSPVNPLYVRPEFLTTSVDQLSIERTLTKLQIAEINQDPEIYYKSLANIITHDYPRHIIVLIKVIESNPKSWEKVKKITKEIISRMHEMKFVLVSVKPSEILTETVPVKPNKPSENIGKNIISSSSIELPKSAMVLKKWEKVWKLISYRIENGEGYSKISKWIEKTHPDLPYSRATLSKIIKAGLDNKLSPKNKQT